MHVVFVAAHAGFASESVPLGGGGAVADALIAEWTRTQPFSFDVLSPHILGPSAPAGRDLVRFSETRYARFCYAFEAAATARILDAYDPRSTAILINDISEAPDFRALAQRGFPLHTIYHVDVVAYVAAIYARGWLRPETLVQWQRRLRALTPRIAQLVFEKQRASVECSRRIIVPSDEMRQTLGRCYGAAAAAKVEVLPWGTWAPTFPQAVVEAEAARLRAELAIPPESRVLLALSRISPEKGQDILLRALRTWNRGPLDVLICGDAAFMQGQRHLAHLRKLAASLDNVRVHFPGFVTGLRKAACFALADLYVFPSRHESYGLTLLEALHAGLPAVALDHHGAREVMRPEFGRIVPEPQLLNAITELLEDDAARQRMSAAARAYAHEHSFSSAAATLAASLRQSLTGEPGPHESLPHAP